METSTTEEGKEPVPLNQDGLPEKLASLRSKLYQKAKKEPRFKFYTLYDRIYRADVLDAAYRRVKANRGSSGVDGVTFEDIEKGEGTQPEIPIGCDPRRQASPSRDSDDT